MNFFSIEKQKTRITFRLLGIKFSIKRRVNLKFIENYFKTSYDKKALISYLTDAYFDLSCYNHSNVMESFLAGEVFSRLGYNVDVIDYREKRDKSFYAKYDVVYGKAMSQAMFSGTKVIPYSGGTAHKNMNKASVLRACEFYKKTGLEPTKSFCEHGNFELIFAYANVLLGNETVLESFKIDGAEQKLYNLDGFYFDTYDIDLDKKDFKESKTHFLWWGSRAAIHKGLDITIDIFKKRPDLTLHICGFNVNNDEREFYQYYKNELDNNVKNIINHNFVDVRSDLFKDLMNKCSTVVSPSISEGGAMGIINVIANGGLIPIITESSGLDVGQYGFMFDNIDTKTVEDYIKKFLDLDTQQIKELSKKVKVDSREKYSMEKYKNRLFEILKEILNDK